MADGYSKSRERRFGCGCIGQDEGTHYPECPQYPESAAPSTGTPAGGERVRDNYAEQALAKMHNVVLGVVTNTEADALVRYVAALRTQLAEAERERDEAQRPVAEQFAARGWNITSAADACDELARLSGEMRALGAAKAFDKLAVTAQSQELARLREGLSELREAVTQFQDAYYAGDEVGESMYRDLLTVAMENTAALAATPTTESDTDGNA